MDVMAAQRIHDEQNGIQSQKQSPVLAVGGLARSRIAQTE